MTLSPGWLNRQLKEVNDDIALWPAWMRREAGLMTKAEKMDQPVTITLKDGDWCVIQGLLTNELSTVRKEHTDSLRRGGGGRGPYIQTLELMRAEIIRRTQ